MVEILQCDLHGEGEATFVCSHLDGEAVGLGFNRADPSEDNPFPDAWCDDSMSIRTPPSQQSLRR